MIVETQNLIAGSLTSTVHPGNLVKTAWPPAITCTTYRVSAGFFAAVHQYPYM